MFKYITSFQQLLVNYEFTNLEIGLMIIILTVLASLLNNKQQNPPTFSFEEIMFSNLDTMRPNDLLNMYYDARNSPNVPSGRISQIRHTIIAYNDDIEPKTFEEIMLTDLNKLGAYEMHNLLYDAYNTQNVPSGRINQIERSYDKLIYDSDIPSSND